MKIYDKYNTIMVCAIRFSKTVLMIVFFFVFAILSLAAAETSPEYIYKSCTSPLFSTDTTYEANLNNLLSSLASRAATTAFSNLTAGHNNASLVYGSFLCRGDVTAVVCRNCVSAASKEIVRRCPARRVAIIWYAECTLRYSDQSFFAVAQDDPRVGSIDEKNVTEPERFMQLLAETMSDIVIRVVTDRTGKRFATKEANFSGEVRLYSLAQCTPDISALGCESCLRGLVSTIPSCCDGKQEASILNPNCRVMYSVSPFYRILASPPQLAGPVSPPGHLPPDSAGKGTIPAQTVVAIVASTVGCVLVFTIVYCLVRRIKSKQGLSTQQDTTGSDIIAPKSFHFDLKTIVIATNKFSNDNKLGEGGFGVVYKGTLPDGQEVAVKRLSGRSEQGTREFKNEVMVVASLQHRNLVRLRGFCVEGKERILVYEFVPNKSLDGFLYDPIKQQQLDWNRRREITAGIARGILYLHEDSRLKIIHRDLKAGNILLDENMNPKIADFGMAKIFGDQTYERTNKIAGTYGYMAPEYAIHGHFSVKSDVFSFGVLLLEIITGRRNNSNFGETDSSENLLSYAWKIWRKGAPITLMDPSLRDSYSEKEVIRYIHIALLCVQEQAVDRPTMPSVLQMLSRNFTLPSPKQPAFLLHSEMGGSLLTESGHSNGDVEPSSINLVSFSELYPRD